MLSFKPTFSLSAFGMDDDSIRHLAIEIGNLLASGEALPADDDETNDEEEIDDGTYEIDIID